MKDVYIHEHHGIICHHFNKIRIKTTIIAEKPEFMVPARTVRYVLNRLKSENFPEVREHFLDVRQCLYLIKR